jgi:hypothetical protein
VAVGIGMVAGAALLLPTGAHADSTYRYWSYWTGGEQWDYSARGPGFRVPADAGVEGWRFVVSPKDGSQAAAPEAPSTYDALCPATVPAPAGQKRVAVVLDFGAPGIAPVGEPTPPRSVTCVTAAAGATGLQVLQQVARLRFAPSGLICGIAGFPASECPGQTARTAPATATPKAPEAPAAPGQVPVPGVTTDPDLPVITPSVTRSATPTPTPTASTYDQQSPVALPLGGEQAAPPASTPPAWIAAIGAAMIAALLGLAVLARRGRR